MHHSGSTQHNQMIKIQPIFLTPLATRSYHFLSIKYTIVPLTRKRHSVVALVVFIFHFRVQSRMKFLFPKHLATRKHERGGSGGGSDTNDEDDDGDDEDDAGGGGGW